MKTIKINASTAYDVMIGENLLDSAGEILKNNNFCGKLAVITDKNVDKLYAQRVINSFETSGFNVFKYVVDGGEESKSGIEFIKILEFLADNEFTRLDSLVALGGGVVGDLTGFVSACYLRGVKFAQIPTTLLAFADSSVGGKTAINLKAGKNLVGAFKQPTVVICDISTSKTLSAEEYACGMAEIIKYGMVFDKELLQLLDKGMVDNAQEIISRSIDWKRTVVERDEFDNGDRQLLNFGHTLGHAIEKESGFTIPHGKAVAVGMRLITIKAIEKGVCDKAVLSILDKLLDKYNLPKYCDVDLQKLVDSTMVDKKRKGGNITVVKPIGVGKCVLDKMTVEQWKEFILG